MSAAGLASMSARFCSNLSPRLPAPPMLRTARTRVLKLRLPANGRARVPMADSVWLVIPQWFEGPARSVNLDPVARKVFIGRDDRGEPVRVVAEFRLEAIPPK